MPPNPWCRERNRARRVPPLVLGLLLAAGGWCAATLPVHADDVTAVSAKASRDYVRTKLPDGSFAAETFAFGKGGYWSGGQRDATIDKLNFTAIAHTIAAPLEHENYRPSKDPNNTKLLIMVYWGTTQVPDPVGASLAMQNAQNASGALGMAKLRAAAGAHAATLNFSGQHVSADSTAGFAEQEAQNTLLDSLQFTDIENRKRDRMDMDNAKLLGYDSWWGSTNHFLQTPMDFLRRDLIDEIEEHRYFVVLMAYDFQLMWKEQKRKLVWETRFSIRQRGNDFSEALAGMVRSASPLFGQDSHGLVHNRLPEGRVEVGEAKTVNYVPGK